MSIELSTLWLSCSQPMYLYTWLRLDSHLSPPALTRANGVRRSMPLFFFFVLICNESSVKAHETTLVPSDSKLHICLFFRNTARPILVSTLSLSPVPRRIFLLLLLFSSATSAFFVFVYPTRRTHPCAIRVQFASFICKSRRTQLVRLRNTTTARATPLRPVAASFDAASAHL